MIQRRLLLFVVSALCIYTTSCSFVVPSRSISHHHPLQIQNRLLFSLDSPQPPPSIRMTHSQIRHWPSLPKNDNLETMSDGTQEDDSHRHGRHPQKQVLPSMSSDVNINNDNINKEIEHYDSSSGFNSVLLLNFVAIIWGTQHSIIKTVVQDCDASAFSLARFGLATILASPYTPSIAPFLKRLSTNLVANDIAQEEKGQASNKDDFLAWKWGLEMGLWMFLGYALQAVGLEYTTAQRSGFLLYLNVKFVPFFARLLFGRDISLATWGSALAALVGTGLIAYDGTMIAWNVGDWLSIAAAAASAMFILRLESASNAVKDSSALNATSLWVVTFASFVWCILEGIHFPFDVDVASSSSLATAWSLSNQGAFAFMTNSLATT